MNDEANAGQQNVRKNLYQRMRWAGWSILAYSLLTALNRLGLILQNAHFELDPVLVLLIYVGYQLIHRNRAVVTVGFIIFVLYDLAGILVIVSFIFGAQDIFWDYYTSWWGKSIAITVFSIGFVWDVINTYLLWTIRSQLNELKEDVSSSGWSNWAILGSALVVLFLVFSAFLVLLNVGWIR